MVTVHALGLWFYKGAHRSTGKGMAIGPLVSTRYGFEKGSSVSTSLHAG